MSTGLKTHRITDPNDDTRFVDVDPYVIEGIARAWAYVSNSSSLNESMNISSLTSGGVGNYTVSYTNNFATSTYADCIGGVVGTNEPGTRLFTKAIDSINYQIASQGTNSDQTNSFNATGLLA